MTSASLFRLVAACAFFLVASGCGGFREDPAPPSHIPFDITDEDAFAELKRNGIDRRVRKAGDGKRYVSFRNERDGKWFRGEEAFQPDGTLWYRRIEHQDGEGNRLEAVQVTHSPDGSYFTQHIWFGTDGNQRFGIDEHFRADGSRSQRIVTSFEKQRVFETRYDEDGSVTKKETRPLREPGA